MLYALTGDQRFRDARAQAIEMQKRGEPIKLKSFLEEAEMKGRAEERREMMDRLIKEKGWDPQEAASFAGLPIPTGVPA